MSSKPDDVTAWYIRETLLAAKALDADAAEEAMSLFRSAVDARMIDGALPEYRLLAEYIAECFWRYEQGATIGNAIGVEVRRRPGQPKGNKKNNEESYAALLILLEQHRGSANKAIATVLKAEKRADGKGPISKRSLEKVHSAYRPLRLWVEQRLTSSDAVERDLGRQLLLTMLRPAHRKLLGNTLQRSSA